MEPRSLGQVMFQVLGPIFLVTLVGYVLQKRLELDIRSVSRVVFYVLSPCLAYNSLITLEFDPTTTWRTLAFAALHMVIMIGLALAVVRQSGYTDGMGAAFLVATILMNNGNYGLPLNLFAFGDEGFAYALVLFLFNTLVASLVSIFALARTQKSARTGAGMAPALRRTLATPVVWAMALGLLGRSTGWQASGPFLDMIALAGRSAIPVFLLVLGMTLAQTHIRQGWRPMLRLTALRMLGGPAVALALRPIFGLAGVAGAVAILQMSMPTAVNTIVLSTEFESKPEFVAGSVLLTTLTSAITLPVLLSLVIGY